PTPFPALTKIARKAHAAVATLVAAECPLVFASSSGCVKRRKAWVRGGRLWHGAAPPPLAPEARGQMVGARLFCADSGRERDIMRKWTARQGTPQAARRRLGAAVPEARRDGRGRRRPIGEDRPGEQGERGEPLAGLRRG